MRVEPIMLTAGAGADAAAEWVRPPLAESGYPAYTLFPPRDRPGEVHGPPCRGMLGSPTALGAQGLHGGVGESGFGLGRALEGRHSRTGAQVRAPASLEFWATEGSEDADKVVGVAVTIELPESVSRLWAQALSRQRPDLERAILTGLEVGVDHVRRNTRLIAYYGSGKPAGEFAHGVAACGVVRVGEPAGEDPGVPRMEAAALVFAAERADGSLVAPDWPVAVAPDVALKATTLAHKTLSDRLVALGYSIEDSALELPPPTLVGRDNAWVPDPFDRYRHLLGLNTERFEVTATLKGDAIAKLDDATLEARRAELGAPFDTLNPERVAQYWYMYARQAELLTDWARGEEEALVLDGRALEAGPSAELMAASATLRERLEHFRDGNFERLESTQRQLLPPTDGVILGHELWDNAVELVAIEREQAIRRREELARSERTAEAIGRDDPPPGAKRIGRGDLAASLKDQRLLRLKTMRASHDSGADRLTRDDVTAPKTLDQLVEVIGEHRAQLLATRTEPLTSWLADPDLKDVVLARHAELGHPEQELARGAARLWRLNEVAQERVTGLLAAARAEEERLNELAANDSGEDREALTDLAEVEWRQIGRHEKELERLKLQAQILAHQGHDLDDLVARDGDRLVRAIAYADEAATIRELAIVKAAKCAEVDPPAYLQDLIGPAPEKLGPDGPEWAPEWKALASEVEYARLSARPDLQTGNDWDPVRLPDALKERIDSLRAQRDLEPRIPARALEAAVEL